MYKLIIEDERLNRLTFNELGGAFQITEIQGLNPPPADISTSETALIDGQIYNSAKLQMRTINIAFAIEYQAEKNRMEVYKVLENKKPVRVYYKSEYRDVYIDGYVQSIDISYFDVKQICTVAILCPQPYLKAAQAITADIKSVTSAFHFPFASTAEPEIVFGVIEAEQHHNFYNDTSSEIGIEIELNITGTLSNPEILNYHTSEFIGLNMTFYAGDVVRISTLKGNKTVKRIRSGVETNIFNSLMENSTWLQLHPGDNELVTSLGTGAIQNLTARVTYQLLYQGV